MSTRTGLLGIVVLVSCGRVGFDARGDTGTGSNCSATETCNGLDDNCDGVVDEGCACTPFDVSPFLAILFDSPGFVWTGDGYFVVAQTNPTRLMRLAEDGSIQQMAQLTGLTQQAAGDDTIAWSGNELALVSTDAGNAVVLALFDRNGAAIGTPIPLGDTTGESPHVMWAGDRFAVAWHDLATPSQAHVIEVSADGIALGAARTLTLANLKTVVRIVPFELGYVLGTLDTSRLGHTVAYDWSTDTYVDHMLGLPASGAAPELVLVPGPGGLGASMGVGAGTVQLLASDGTPRTGAIVLPAFNGQFSLFATLAPSGMRYRTVLEAGLGSTPTDMVVMDVDLDGNVVTTPTSFATFTTNGIGLQSEVTAAGRSATVWTYDAGTAPGTMRIVQQCF